MLGVEALVAVTDHCGAHGIRIVADEIYHGIVEDPAPQMLDHHSDAFVISSFSKYWSMTGWRVGWVVAPDSVVDTVERLQQNLFICAPHVSQVAALAALDATEELDGHVHRYRANRLVMLDGLAAAGIDEIAPADGAFYVYAHLPQYTTELGIDSLELCHRWLDEIGVCATPGSTSTSPAATSTSGSPTPVTATASSRRATSSPRGHPERPSASFVRPAVDSPHMRRRFPRCPPGRDTARRSRGSRAVVLDGWRGSTPEPGAMTDRDSALSATL